MTLFISQRISRTSVIAINEEIEKVFPLFTPIREKEWAEGWNPEILYPENGSIEERMIFQTASPGHGEINYTWVISKYQPDNGFIEYTVFTHERVWWITIQCREGNNNKTTMAEITYTYSGLSGTGNGINRLMLQNMYARDLKDWEDAINHYLASEKRLTHH